MHQFVLGHQGTGPARQASQNGKHLRPQRNMGTAGSAQLFMFEIEHEAGQLHTIGVIFSVHWSVSPLSHGRPALRGLGPRRTHADLMRGKPAAP
jgi:hypothetical protein